MRVLVVDQDSASNEAIVRSLREHYVVDTVSNKGDCLDLLRSNTFEVIVASERLEDGSGLELLGQISKKYPSILRIFAADRQRLKLLKGRLGPFELFQTLTYPIDPERLLATLTLADAIQDAHADTSHIQHVELSGTLEAEEPEAFPTPQPVPRAAAESAGAASRGGQAAAHNGTPQKARTVSGQRPRRAGAAGQPANRPPLGAAPAGRAAAPTASRSSGAGGSPHRHGRLRAGTNKAPPVRFPPLELPQQTPAPSSSFAETAAMVRSARSNLVESPDEFDYKRIAVLVGTGAIIVLGVIVLGFKLFGSKSDAPKQAVAPAAQQAPEYPREVTDLIAQTESALTTEDFKGARADVDRLRQLAPSHPRLAFFESLLAQKNNGSKVASADTAHAGAGGRGSAKHNSQGSRKGSGETNDDRLSETAGPAATGSTTANVAKEGSGSAPTNGSAESSGGSASQSTSGLAPETPPGVSRPSTASVAPSSLPEATASPPATLPSATAQTAAAGEPTGSGSGSTSTTATSKASTATQSSGSSSARHANSDEPPPVVQEAKLIRRVNPDYPSTAKKEGISGFVDLQVRVSQQGIVKDVTVVTSSPPEVFDKAALAAVRKWKYDPRFVDGLPSEAELKVHLEFRPGQ
jgi:periplasmic protein TonB